MTQISAPVLALPINGGGRVWANVGSGRSPKRGEWASHASLGRAIESRQRPQVDGMGATAPQARELLGGTTELVSNYM